MYRDISTEDMIFATPTLKESELYLMQQKGNTKQTKQQYDTSQLLKHNLVLDNFTHQN